MLMILKGILSERNLFIHSLLLCKFFAIMLFAEPFNRVMTTISFFFGMVDRAEIKPNKAQ